MPRFGKEGPTIDAIAEAAMTLYQKATETLPCTRLAISAHDFTPAALTEQQGAITKFFGGPAATSSAGLSFVTLSYDSRLHMHHSNLSVWCEAQSEQPSTDCGILENILLGGAYVGFFVTHAALQPPCSSSVPL